MSWQSIKKFWHCYIAAIGIAVAAIFTAQPDVPIHNPPQYRQVSNTRIELTQPYCVTTSLAVISIAEGFECDGASIPQVAWGLLGLQPLSGVLLRGAVVHDALYAAELLPRDQADTILRELILQDGCEPRKAETVYNAVRDFGGLVWARHTPATTAEARTKVAIR